jgi:hypothetical protein
LIIEKNLNLDANLIFSVKSELKVEAPNTAIGDLLGLNEYVVGEIKKFVPLLRDKALEQYGDLDVSKFAKFKISKTHVLSVDSIVDYLLDVRQGRGLLQFQNIATLIS